MICIKADAATGRTLYRGIWHGKHRARKLSGVGMDHGNHEHKATRFGFLRANIVLIAFIAIGGFYLVTEHRAHLLGWLPFLFILACPLMHLFMHHGGGHGGSGNAAEKGERDQDGDSVSHHH
ncbi:DUF2933 domain-containing protein [Burkholderia ubonensis]|uniref:DUF2933 domain-containing protein n=2 Tax=Burkholderia ubonensis TaxID=101571 RepID=UPI0039F5C7AD